MYFIQPSILFRLYLCLTSWIILINNEIGTLKKSFQEKLGPNGAVTPAILNEMKYLKAVQHESQRLLPATTGVGRRIEVVILLRHFAFFLAAVRL